MNVLAVGAHFDDVELGCGGSLARHVSEGDTVSVYVATDSGYGTYDGHLIRSGDIAREEGERAAMALGCRLLCGVQRTFQLEFEEETNAAVVKVIEENNIDCVYAPWIGDVHHDHYQLARAVLHATRHVPKVLMYRSNWYPGAEPFHGSFFVDISNSWELKKEAILCHRSEYERVGGKWLAYFDREALNNGLIAGVERAECFLPVKWLV